GHLQSLVLAEPFEPGRRFWRIFHCLTHARTIAERTRIAYPLRVGDPCPASRGRFRDQILPFGRDRPLAAGSASTPRLGAEADLLGQLAALLGVVGRDHGIVGRKAPAL